MKRKFFLASLLINPVVYAESDLRYTLKQFVEAAQNNGNQLGEQRSKVEYSESRLEFANSKGLPSGDLESLFAAVPGADGNAVAGRTRWDRIGPFSSTKIEIVQPIYTFGAISAGKEAARAGLEAEKNLLEKEKWALRSEVTELYFGYQLAFELSEIAAEVQSKLQEALKRVEKSSNRKASSIDKLRMYLGEVQVRAGEAQKALDQTRMGMAWKLGVYGRSIPKWDRANLAERDINLKNLNEYQEIARRERPELKALQHEVKARTALVGVEKALMMPAFFVGGRVEYSVAPNREKQNSPFAYDPANVLSAGLGIGLKWSFGFEKSSKLGEARAEQHQAESKSKHLSDGIMAEIEKIFLDLKQAKEALKIRSDLSRINKRMYQDSMAQLGLGTGDPKNLLENLGTFTLSEKARLEAIYNVNILAAKFEQSLGSEL